MRLYVTVDNALVGVGEPCRGLAQPEEFSAESDPRLSMSALRSPPGTYSMTM